MQREMAGSYRTQRCQYAAQGGEQGFVVHLFVPLRRKFGVDVDILTGESPASHQGILSSAKAKTPLGEGVMRIRVPSQAPSYAALHEPFVVTIRPSDEKRRGFPWKTSTFRFFEDRSSITSSVAVCASSTTRESMSRRSLPGRRHLSSGRGHGMVAIGGEPMRPSGIRDEAARMRRFFRHCPFYRQCRSLPALLILPPLHQKTKSL